MVSLGRERLSFDAFMRRVEIDFPSPSQSALENGFRVRPGMTKRRNWVFFWWHQRVIRIQIRPNQEADTFPYFEFNRLNTDGKRSMSVWGRNRAAM